MNLEELKQELSHYKGQFNIAAEMLDKVKEFVVETENEELKEILLPIYDRDELEMDI